MAIPFEKLKAHPPANPKIGAEHDALAPEFEIAVELRRARLSAGLLQAELAARMGSSRSTIAPLASAKRYRARRRCCATPRHPATSFACGRRRLDAAFARDTG